MLTTSHAYLTWRVARGPTVGWAVAGSVAPDTPAIARAVALAARGDRGADLLRAVYQSGAVPNVTTLFHSALTPAAVLYGRPGARRLGFAIGWAGHLALDYLTHHTDAWPPFFPFSRRRFASPVSYREESHHARVVSLAETAGLAALAATDRRVWRRRVGFVVAALAAFPALRPGVFASHAQATLRPSLPLPGNQASSGEPSPP